MADIRFARAVAAPEVPLPAVVPIRQVFPAPRVPDVPAAVAAGLMRPEVADRVGPGLRVAIGVGSRGITGIAVVVREVVAALRARGAVPFVVPAMGSHGSATAEGQRRVLAGLGVDEASVGCPVRATLDVVEAGRLEDGTPVWLDRYAASADALVVIARIKPHTGFRGPTESGIVKMLAVGLGNQAGATALHARGMPALATRLPAAARVVLQRVPLLFGIALVENAADQTAVVEAVTPERLFEREPELLALARDLLPRLLFDDLDVLVLDEMGKDVSGTGFDPNVTGRNRRGIPWEERPRISRIVPLRLTEGTHGNATGLGMADVIPAALFEQIDPVATYANVIAATYLDGAAIPLVAPSDQAAIALAVASLAGVPPAAARLVHARSTRDLGLLEVSEPMLAEVRARTGSFEVLGPARPLAFDAAGALAPVRQPAAGSAVTGAS